MLPGSFWRMLNHRGRLTPGQINFVDTVSLTSQEFVDETNINLIVKRFATKGIQPPSARGAPKYGDFTSVGDYMEAQQKYLSAQEMFLTLPARLRAQLHNNPAEFLVWIADPGNRPQAESLGLITKATTPVDAQAPAPAPAPATTPPKGPSGL